MKKKFDYFDSFEQLAEKTIQEADLLIEAIENFDQGSNLQNTMQKAHEVEHAGDIINHQIFKNIAIDFITPFDREDLLELSHNLDNIIDNLEEVIQQFYIFNVQEMMPAAIEFAKIIKKACLALYECTKQLKNYKKNREEIRHYIVKVNDAEEEGDLLYMDSIRQLFSEKDPHPQKVIVWKSIFYDLEECCDTCEHVSDVIRTVILKNS